MYIVRDIFHLHFGKFREAQTLLAEASAKGLLPDARSARVLTDFTGQAYRLIFEEGYDTLAAYETSLADSTGKSSWKKWYEKFKPLIRYSEREILKLII
jgi:hypothetical protein